MHGEFLAQVVVLLFGAVLVVGFFHRLHLPAILGYLVLGALIGPHALGLITDEASIHTIAELGIVFLLFVIGLEFSLPKLVAMRHTLLGLGGAQVVICTALAWGIVWALGVPAPEAFVVAAAVALSSTAVVMKILAEQGAMDTAYGRASVGVLLFQDLAAVPFLIIVPMLAGSDSTQFSGDSIGVIVRNLVIITIALGCGHWLLNPLFREVASTQSPELFSLTVLSVALTAAWLTGLLELSLPLGAFLAGMLLSETEYRHQIEADMRPFQDILLGLFFISVGMWLDFAVVMANWGTILLCLVALVVTKTVVIAGLARLMRLQWASAIRTGLTLSQAGEFGLVLLTLAASYGMLDDALGQQVLAVLVLSIALAPFLMRYSEPLSGMIMGLGWQNSATQAEEKLSEATRQMDQHVIICGFGRIGQSIARFLTQEKITFAALDRDPVRVKEAYLGGENIFFGDATRREVLLAAGIQRARMVVIGFDKDSDIMQILQRCQALRPDIPVLVRTRDDTHLQKYQQAGAAEVVPETLEGSLMLESHLLLMLGVPVSKVIRRVRDVRRDRYELLHGFYHGEKPQSIDTPNLRKIQRHAVTLPPGAHFLEHHLDEAPLAECGVEVTSIRREGVELAAPLSKVLLQAGDIVVLHGYPDDLEHAERLLLKG